MTRARALAAAVACVAALHARDVVAAPAEIRYDEDGLVRYALANSPDLRVLRSQQDIATAEARTAAEIGNPTARGEWLHVQSAQEYGWGVGLQWTPPRPGVYGNHKDAASARARAVKEDYAEARADLEARVRSCFSDVSALGEEIALAEQSIETRRKLKQAMQERVEHGAATRIELSLVTVSLARGEQERDLLVLSRASAVADLGSLAGLPPGTALEIDSKASLDEAPPREDPARSAEEPEVDSALSARPVIQADTARALAADANLATERARRWPWLTVEGRYRHHDQSNYPDDVTLGVEVTLPILNQNGGAVDAAAAQKRQQADLAALHRYQIARDVRVLRAEKARRSELSRHYAEAIAPVLRTHAELVRQALAGMEVDLTAVLAAEDMVTRGGIDYTEARLAERKVEIALSRAAGAYGRSGR
ncbi:MAG TPA: TolC family protein [Polyangiaceae bacterium]|nr:TolC family protein [Polyangiaceae bacterium]